MPKIKYPSPKYCKVKIKKKLYAAVYHNSTTIYSEHTARPNPKSLTPDSSPNSKPIPLSTLPKTLKAFLSKHSFSLFSIALKEPSARKVTDIIDPPSESYSNSMETTLLSAILRRIA
jgi:hypothetical protein